MGVFKFSLIALLISVVIGYLFQIHLFLPLNITNVYNVLPTQLMNLLNLEKNTKVPDIEQTPVFTKAELWKDYRGDEGSKGLYLAFFGRVYDVSNGKQYYAPGGGYHFFSGRDGTRGFVTGDFSDEGLIDTLDGLDTALYGGFQEWIDFYEKTYKFVGYLEGNFYDKEGKPTAALNAALEQIKLSQLARERVKKDQQLFPLCNSESSAKGSRVWCSKRSGGVERDWVGVPRLYHTPGARSSRCACIRTHGSPAGSDEVTTNRGDLDNPLMKEYPGCDSIAASCVTSKS